MPPSIRRSLLIDLDLVDANVDRLFAAGKERGVAVRVHFKSLKCTGLAKYVAARGANGFLCAKLNEAEALADAGLTDLYLANQIVGPIKLARLAVLAKRAQVRVCVDDADNVARMGEAARAAGATIGVLVEVDVGMKRCGVDAGEPALALAKQVRETAGLRFLGLQGYDGHLQMLADPAERRAKCLEGMEKLVGTRRLIEKAGIPVEVVTGGGTGTWEFVSSIPGITEIQPGSFVIMDCAYHAVRPEFGCALSIRATVVSRRPGQYVLDAGSKAISRDFGSPGHQGPAGGPRHEALGRAHSCRDRRPGRPRRRCLRGHPGPLLCHHEPAPELRGSAARPGRGNLAHRSQRAI